MQIYRNRRKDIKPTMEGQNKSLFQLFVPLCLETIFYMLSGMVDTLMLSSVGDQAVGAVGTANTYIGVFIIMYSVVSMGIYHRKLTYFYFYSNLTIISSDPLHRKACLCTLN